MSLNFFPYLSLVWVTKSWTQLSDFHSLTQSWKWVSQVVKNLPAMLETQITWVQSLDQEDPLEKGRATHSSILAWRISWTSPRVTKSWTRLSDFHYFTPWKESYDQPR